MIIDLDMEKCVSCGACAVACMDQNDTDPLNGDVPFRSVYTLEEQVGERIRYTNLSMACMHCADAPCGALSVYATQEEYLSAKRKHSLQTICRSLTER